MLRNIQTIKDETEWRGFNKARFTLSYGISNKIRPSEMITLMGAHSSLMIAEAMGDRVTLAVIFAFGVIIAY